MTKELVTMAERKWIAENAVIEMGSAIKFKVMDLNKVVKKIQQDRAEANVSPYVEIQPVSADAHKMPNRLATFQKDPDTGVLYGIAIDQDEFGNIRWQKIQLHDHLSLNLDRPEEAKVWAVLRFHPDIQGSPWQNDAPYYKIFDPTEVAKSEMSEIAAMKKAFGRVDKIKDRPRDMVLFARYLGEDLRENSNLDIVQGALLRFAKNRPFLFNQKWDSNERSFAERFHTGLALGIITQDVDRGYIYRQFQLGVTEEESIRFLKRDSNITGSLAHEIQEKDTLVKHVEKEYENSKKDPDSDDEGNGTGELVGAEKGTGDDNDDFD